MRQPDGGYSREQVAELIRAAVYAGWTVAASGRFRFAAPEPVITWVDGAPQIVAWREVGSNNGGKNLR